MSENLIDTVVDQMAAPVTPVQSAPVRRLPSGASADTEDGARAAVVGFYPTILFAGGDEA